ncbi:hypothetical protein ID866_6047 [Astraeus odoratus]|nr:hypothetical protein ID866_6047 [Astraeus odoratus]
MDIPEPAREFFSSVSNPSDILSSKLVSRIEGTQAIEGSYNTTHILNLDIGQSKRLPFVLRVPLDPENISRWQTSTFIGCMLYCQRHPELHIPTPVVYAYNLTFGSEFVAMEYIDGDTLSNVWLDLPEEEKENVVCQIVEMMKTMRATRFTTIGGIDPDGFPCPMVDGMDASNGRHSTVKVFTPLARSCFHPSTAPSCPLTSFLGRYKSLREWAGSIYDREFHYMDQILHKGTLPQYEATFREEMEAWLVYLTPEQAFDRIARKRNEFHSLTEPPFHVDYPFVLRHGDLHGRNIIVSHSSPRRIMAVIDWDFGGSHALPFADKDFEVISDPEDEAGAEEQFRWQDKIEELVGELPYDFPLMNSVMSIKLDILNASAKAEAEAAANEHSTQADEATSVAA